MATQTKHRLGDILISKGLITPIQLNIAMEEQKKRRQQLDPLDFAAQTSVAPLGEILIELGFIDRMQLKRGLGWQSVVRKVTFAMSLCAPLLSISYEAAAAPLVPIVSSSSSSKTNNAFSVPLTIQAEDYTSMNGIQTEPTTDAGGGLNVGYIDANDSMTYTSSSVNILVTGTYKITYRVASTVAGGSFSLSEDTTTYDTVAVPNTGGYQKWVDVERTVTLSAGAHTFKIKALVGGFNINWFKIESTGASLPQTIQAESYSKMTGVQTETTTDTGGGLNVGYIDANDTMSYESNTINIPTSGSYQITYRVASGTGGGKFILNEVGSTSAYDTVTVPGTGSWQTWTTITRTVTLPAGPHKFGITSLTGGFNINWFKIEKPTASASSTSSVATSSSKAATTTKSSSSTPVVTVSSTPKVSSSAPIIVSSSSKAATPIASSSTTTVSSSSSAAASNTLPFTIKANSFSVMSGIQTETTSDTGGGTNVGYIDANDWLDFGNSSVNIPITGTYKVSYRVASASGGGSFILNEAGESKAYDTVQVPSTGGWQNWTTLEREVTLTAGVHSFGVTALNGGFNLNWFKIEQVSTPLPITIEAEKYSAMSGIQTETTSDTGGGLNVGYIDANDWMAYSDVSIVVATAGTYTITYRVASTTTSGSFSLTEVGSSISLDKVTVPNTGGWQKWVDVTHDINLSAGVHTFKVNAITSGFNLNWFKINKANSTTTTSSAANTSKVSVTSSASSQATITTANSSSTASFSSSSAAGGSTSVVDGVVVSKVAGPVSMNWIAPNARQNGTVLDITEIAGYEIRYKLSGAANFTYISINDAWTNMYNFAWLEGNYVFQIAAFDKDGLYSEFVDVVSR